MENSEEYLNQFSNCKKVKYCSKKTANEHLKKITSRPQNHKKPVRSYECDKLNAAVGT